MANQIYSVLCDELFQENGGNWVRKNGHLIEAFYQSEDETDKETIAAGYCRVEVEGVTDGNTTLWASIFDLNEAGVELNEEDIVA